jgi:hypothetical protein
MLKRLPIDLVFADAKEMVGSKKGTELGGRQTQGLRRTTCTTHFATTPQPLDGLQKGKKMDLQGIEPWTTPRLSVRFLRIPNARC